MEKQLTKEEDISKMNIHQRRELEKGKKHICSNCGGEIEGWSGDNIPNTYLTCICPHCKEQNHFKYFP